MPKELDERYNKPIREAFQTFLRDPEGGKASVFESLEEAYTDFVERVASGSGIQDTNANLEQGLEDLTQASVEAIESGQDEARGAVENAHQRGYEAAAAAAGVSVPDWTPSSDVDPYENAPFDGNIRAFVRGSVEEEISFFEQDLKFIRKYVDEDEYARAVGQVLARGNDNVKQALARRGIDLDDIPESALKDEAASVFRNASRMGDPDIRGILEEIDPQDLSQRNPRLFQRIRAHGTDSLPRVMDEVAKDLAVQSPATKLVEWTLSSRHGSLRSSPDECDVLAGQDLYGFGAGVYHPKTAPSHPHPNCECRIAVVTADPENWGEQGPERPEAFDITEEQIRSNLEEAAGERAITDAHVQRVKDMVEGTVSQIHSNPRNS
jgi:hypothetical protein